MEILDEKPKKYDMNAFFKDVLVLAAMAAFSFWIERALVAGIVG